MTDKNPLVSVIMNCFNGEKYLLKATDSVLKQKYQNWELIFWDNKSTDSSEKIFKSIKDKRFKYFLADKHTSLYKARNLAIEKANGIYLSFLDTDDYWLPDKIKEQIDLINKKNVGVVYSNLWIYNDQRNKKKLFIKKQLYQGNIFNQLVEDYNIAINTVFIKKSKLSELNKKFDERFNHVGDFDLMMRLSKITSFAAIPHPTAVFRAHGNNLSTTDKLGSIKELEIWLNENKDDLSSANIKHLQKRIDTRKIIYFKFNNMHLGAIKLLFKKKENLTFKNLAIAIIPSFILRKILWY